MSDILHHNWFPTRRRATREVLVRDIGIGGDNPLRIQSMLTCPTSDTAQCVEQTHRLAAAGCEIVRLAAPTVRDAANLANIRAATGEIPLVADIHFKPEAAFEAALHVDKIRINPGNYADRKQPQRSTSEPDGTHDGDYTTTRLHDYATPPTHSTAPAARVRQSVGGEAAVETSAESRSRGVASPEAASPPSPASAEGAAPEEIAYTAAVSRARTRFEPLVRLCQQRNIPMRIGVNHGSLSDRIMHRYGDTVEGMVESALEFARFARDLDFHDLVFSMKASNVRIVIAAYRLLADRLDALAWNYPIHLGVTEAGDGEDGRIKSAIGIGSLLADGVGDTLRVSLTEDSVEEIPVARALARIAPGLMWRASGSHDNGDYATAVRNRRSVSGEAAVDTSVGSRSRVVDGSRVVESPEAAAPPSPVTAEGVPLLATHLPNPYHYTRRPSQAVGTIGGTHPISILTTAEQPPETGFPADATVPPHTAIDPRDDTAIAALNATGTPTLVTVADMLDLPVIGAFRLLAARLDPRHPILLKDDLMINESSDSRNLSDSSDSRLINSDPTTSRAEGAKPISHYPLSSAIILGSLLCDGIGDAVLVRRPPRPLETAYNILQACGVRLYKTEYIACPSCGRTLFDLRETTARVKAATAHLVGLKIAVMGCIVNGPGEMADADFGYVGGAPGKVNLYVGKTPVAFHIPQEQAVERLVALIKEHGRWVEQPLDN